MKKFRYLENVATVALDVRACIGCGRCIEVCPHQVFVPDGKKVALDDRDACMECGACALNCPAKALTVESGVGCASGLINEWLQNYRIGTVSSGGCCS